MQLFCVCTGCVVVPFHTYSSFSFVFSISVLPDIQIEDAGKTPAPLKMAILGSSQKIEFDVET